jgi:parvulin-like peptidyl-prolyl isomerase
MRKLVLMAVALMLAAAPAFAQDKKPADKPAAPAADKTLSAAGAVTAVTADSLSVKGKTAEWTFAVDAKTQVTATGASHKTAAAKADNKPTPITDFVHVGDQVSVKYHDGATKHAASVRVTAKAAAPKK